MPKKFLLNIGTVLAALALGFGLHALYTKFSAKPDPLFQSASAPGQPETPADRQIRAAQGVIERMPKAAAGYNLLAIAFMQKARETGDFAVNARAEAAIKRSLELAPGNQEATRLQAYLLLTYHRFGEALEVARRAVEQQPRDYEAYGALTDALVELGRYDEARKSVQAMLDLRPYTASYARASYLRSLYGNTEGAIEAMRLAVQSANPGNPENVAWCYVHLGDELMNAGRRDEAEKEYDRALFAFPDYYLALAAKARARVAAGDLEGAVGFYARSLERVPSPEVAAEFGNLLTKLGRAGEAKRQYDLVEFIEREGAAGADTYSRNLALFWADRGTKLDEALAIARRERAKRADIYTNDVLAWCLFKKGQLDEARAEIEQALRLGTKDPHIHYHAGMIYHALGDRQKASHHLKLALETNAAFDVLQSEVARRTLDAVGA
jgi:tetratricopeptide (TPR) repeat protein